MTSTFAERCDELRRMNGDGSRITASVTVDQVYAHYQHEHLDFHHPRGGEAKYLEGPLYTNYAGYLDTYAREVLTDGGHRALENVAEHLSNEVELHAPREWGDLGKSGHPQVTEAEKIIYDRPPHVQRLTEPELRAKSRAIFRQRLAAGLTVYFMRGGKVIVIPGKNEPHALRGRL